MEDKEATGLKKLFKELVGIIHSKAVYGSVLLTEYSDFDITRDFTTIDISNTGEKGVKIRAFDGEKWRETFATNLEPDNLRKITRDLVRDIKIKPDGIRFEEEKLEKSFSDKHEIEPEKVPVTKKIAAVDKIIGFMKKQKNLKNCRALYEERIVKNIFCSKNKYLSQKLSRVLAICFAMVEDKEGQIRYAYDDSFSTGFEAAKNALKIAKSAAKEAKDVARAGKIKPGKYHCILAPDITGLLAHESFGHGMESDTVYKDRALAKEWVGKRIAADFVSIIDDPSMKYRHGSLYFDDEGQMAAPTYLLKKGIVADYITEMLTAKKLNAKRSANGRCESFDHKIYARMTNTVFARGPHSLKEMIENVKDGILLKGRGGGMEDPKGWGVQIQGIFCQRIRNGKLTDEFYDDVGVTGYLPEILGNIKQVSKEGFRTRDIGHCGKGHKEWVDVSEGGPYLRIENLDLA